MYCLHKQGDAGGIDGGGHHHGGEPAASRGGGAGGGGLLGGAAGRGGGERAGRDGIGQPPVGEEGGCGCVFLPLLFFAHLINCAHLVNLTLTDFPAIDHTQKPLTQPSHT